MQSLYSPCVYCHPVQREHICCVPLFCYVNNIGNFNPITYSFPTAFFVNRMEEVFSVMKKAEPKESVICESCSELPSTAFCQQCSEYICTECAKAHKKMRLFSSHKVVSIDSLRTTVGKSPADSLPVVCQEVKCSKHKDEPLKLYCRDCHKLVCRDCIVIDHKDHEYAFVVDAAPQCKSEIKRKAESVNQISVGLRSAVKSLSDSEKELSDHSTATMKAIDYAVDKVASKLMQKRKELKEEARRVVNKAKEDISIQEKNAQLAVGEVESLLEFMNRNLEKATDQEVLSLEKQMSDQVDRISQLYTNPAQMFPSPKLPQLEVQSNAEVMQVIEDSISITNREHVPLAVTPDDTPADKPAEGRTSVFPNLNPDALALLQRLPEGDIPGVQYNAREGYVRILFQDECDADEAISKFQDAYKKVASSHSRRLRAECVVIPAARSMEEVKVQIAKYEQMYLYCAFVLDEETRQVRIISQSRQFEQAKQFFSEALKNPPAASASTMKASKVAAESLVITLPNKRTLTLKRGNIVNEKADILVNAANRHLRHGGGVAGALNAASEGKLQQYCNKYMETKRKWKELPVGEVAVTYAGGNLKCQHVIHAVGPDGNTHSPSECERLVKMAICNTLRAAERHNVTSVALPALSCGLFGVSKDLVARSMIDAIMTFTFAKPLPVLSDMHIVIIDEPTHSCFATLFKQFVQPSKKASKKKNAATDHSSRASKPSTNGGKNVPLVGSIVL